MIISSRVASALCALALSSLEPMALTWVEAQTRQERASLEGSDDTAAFFRAAIGLRSGMQRAVVSLESLAPRSRDCAMPHASAALEDLRVLAEYFSVSNDAAQKMMVGDAFPGQKHAFAVQGVDATLAELRAVRTCINQ